MDKEKANAEVKYRLAKIIAMDLYCEGLITQEEMNSLITTFLNQFQPMIGELERGEFSEASPQS